MATRMKIALVSSALSLFMFVTLFWMQFGSTEMENPKKPAKISKRDDKKSPSTKIKCEENETLIYDYESQTSLWEKSGGIFHLSALVSVHCMGKEPVEVTTDSYKLGYLIQIGDMKIELKNKSYHGINVFNSNIEKSEAFENLLKSIFIPSGKIRINEDSKITEVFVERTTLLNRIEIYNLPFLFFQYENGNFADIFFLNEDNSSFIRNFKRHLAYTLVTSLNENVTNVAEETPYGNQKIYYNSESADGIAREMFGWKFQKPLSSNNILVKHWIDSKDNIEYDQENTYEFNDQHQFDFWYIQLQLFRNGKMIEAKGKCSHEFSNSLGKLQMQFIDINKDELIRDFKVQSSFVFKLRSYKKRSIPENININYLKSEFQFISSSLLPEYEAGK
ncbi:uncharacterized protein [Centruroides vittatus]|uniref:uncharacterized protein n=1 Tax=Centruroides vittatus TaxID=120091 RepID=UPI00350FDCDE